MPVVYIIQSQQGHVYVGCTTDLPKRLNQHNNHQAGWTKRGTNWKLIHSEYFPTLSEARKRERWFKTGTGRNYIKKILNHPSGS